MLLEELALLLSVAACGWLTLDSLFARGSRLRSLPLASLAGGCALWTAGEILYRIAELPGELRFSRQLGYLGVCTIPAALLWLGARADRPRWWRRWPGLVALSALPGLFCYSTLYWSPVPLLVDPISPVPRPGPLFVWHLGYAWALTGIGFAHLGHAVFRLRRADPFRLAALCAGIGLPLLGNAVYNVGRLAFDLALSDPTPLLLGLAVFLFRSAVVDSGVSLALPVGRREVIEQLDVGIITADLEGHVADANSRAHELLGEARLEDRPLAPLLEAARRRVEPALEVRRFPLRSGSGVLGEGVVLTDRTAAQHAERKLRLAARLEAVGSLTAGIAHEVNNPLAFIRANLSQLEKLAESLTRSDVRERLPAELQPAAAEAHELVDETRDGIDRIGRIVDRLRDFARDEPSPTDDVQPVDLERAARRALALAQVGLPEEAVTIRSLGAPRVHAHEGDVVQILLNLLVNATYATAGLGPIEVVLDRCEVGARVRVLDRGTGIPSDVLPHVFDPFFTTKPTGQGSGLGLSVSYDLARRHGGQLDASQREGGGAAFTLWLPPFREGNPD